jgi:alpha-L-arabinofuranosidase
MLPSLLLSLTAVAQAPAPAIRIHVDTRKVGHAIPKSLYGIFFEEINQAGDGGIYAELLRNRGFEQASEGTLPVGWKEVRENSAGTITLDKANPLNRAHPHSLRIEKSGAGGSFGALNQGFWGIPLRKGERYKATVWVRGSAPFSIGLHGDPGAPGTEASYTAPGDRWRKVEKVFTANLDSTNGSLAILALSPQRPLWIGYASLMPVETWKGRENGLRKDLAEAVDAMRPGFVRFPGGCYVEGGDRLADAFDWKRSVAPIEERLGLAHSMWGYPNTFGLGYHEYLQWCEDMKAEPLYVVNCGLSHREMTPMSQMDRWVENTLDAIEYANGPVTSKWGAVRARNGHPKPFGLKYIEIGNENGYSWAYGGLPAYQERYKLIFDAIKKRYPNILTVADTPVPHPMEIVDEHYYMSSAWFWQNTTRYDRYPRSGPKIYVGEYAVTQGAGTGNLSAALGEAAFMVGMERNSDVVQLSSYAPLLVNVNNKQWNPDAIVYDNHRWYGTPSYHVQRLFGTNRPSRMLGHTIVAPVPAYSFGGGVGLQTWRSKAEFKDLRVEADGHELPVGSSWQFVRGEWSADGGVIRQTGEGDDRRAMLQGLSLDGAHKYRIDLKARKTGGDEGFIVMFGARGAGDYIQWNVGGWGNTRHAFERAMAGGRSTVGEGVNGHVETGRWYDIRIEGDGPRIRAYLDGKLIEEIVDKPVPDFTAIAGWDDKTKEVVIKAVNGSDAPREAEIDLGAGRFAPTGTAIVLAGPTLAAENSFAAPTRVAPKTVKITGVSNKFRYHLEPRSVTVLRVSPRR